MDVMDVRRKNLRRLLSRNFDGKQSVMAECLGMSPSFLSQLINGHRGIGEKTARKIEAACLSGPYSMDMDLIDEAHSGQPSPAAATGEESRRLESVGYSVSAIGEPVPKYTALTRDELLAQNISELPHYLKSYIELLIARHNKDPDQTKNHVKGAMLMMR